MLENFLRPEVLLSNVIVCLATLLITRWALKRKKKPQRQKETVQIPKQTADGAAVLEASLTTLRSYKNNLNQYGYAYFQETTPIVIEQLKAEANSLILSEGTQTIHDLLQKNYERLISFQQQEVADTKKLELEVLNHVNKTIIDWRNLLKHSK